MVFLKTNKHAWHHMPIEVYLHLQWQHQVQPTLQNQVPLHPRVVKRRPAWQKAQIVLSWGFGFRNIFFFCIELNWFQAASKLCEIKFEDFASYDRSHYKILISRCQQLALDKCGAAVPLPADQLAMANQKKDKEPRSYHGRWQHFLFFCKGSLLQGSCVEWPAFKYPWARIGPKHRL